MGLWESCADAVDLADHMGGERMQLEGIVSKRRAAPYRSGECRDWRKVKTIAWLKASWERWWLFEGR
jgi:ATP-dependent DNA ligase